MSMTMFSSLEQKGIFSIRYKSYTFVRARAAEGADLTFSTDLPSS